MQQYFLHVTYVKTIDNDVTHRKTFTIIKILVTFIFLNMANLLLINRLFSIEL